jgi:hypothetical protein
MWQSEFIGLLDLVAGYIAIDINNLLIQIARLHSA